MAHDDLYWEGETVFDSNGTRVGTIDAIYADSDIRIQWATVTTGWFARTSLFVPLRDAQRTPQGIVIAHAGDRIKRAPRIAPNETLSDEEQRQLHAHYGLGDHLRGGGLDRCDEDEPAVHVAFRTQF